MDKKEGKLKPNRGGMKGVRCIGDLLHEVD